MLLMKVNEAHTLCRGFAMVMNAKGKRADRCVTVTTQLPHMLYKYKTFLNTSFKLTKMLELATTTMR